MKSLKFPNIKAVIFDLDGTLIRSSINFKQMKKSIIDLLVKNGLRYSIFSESWKTTKIIEVGKKNLKDKGFNDNEIRKVLNSVTETMNNVEMENVSKTVQIEGARKTILALRERGLRIGVLTRGCRRYANEALKRTDMLKLIDVFLARDDTDRPKPDPHHLLKIIQSLNIKPEETIMVGDSTLDATCAVDANVLFIGVLTGIANREELIKAGSYIVLPNVTDITTLIS